MQSRGATGRMSAWMCAALLVLGACSGGDNGATASDPQASDAVESDQADDTEPEVATSSTTAPAAPVTTMPRATSTQLVLDPDTGEVVESDEPLPGPTTYGEVVDFGVDAGLWDEAAGLTAVLGAVVGGVERDQVPGIDEVVSGELDEVLTRAAALSVDPAYSSDDLADLERWFHFVVPSTEALDALAVGAESVDVEPAPTATTATTAATVTTVPTTEPVGTDGPDGFARFEAHGLRAPAQADDCPTIDADDFSSWGDYAGCYQVLTDQVGDATLSVYYPAWYDDDPAFSAMALAAFEALVHSATTYQSLATIGDTELIISQINTTDQISVDENGDYAGATLAVASHDATWGNATRADTCPITVFPYAAESSTGAFQQTIAHEMWHCVQWYEGYGQGVSSGDAWFMEGGAEYFSNVAYPTVDDEHGWVYQFDTTSGHNSLFDMSYEAWIWWQFLGNRTSPAAVADLQHGMNRAGDGGAAAMVGYGPVFQRFVIEYLAGTIADASGTAIPRDRRYQGREQVAEGSAGSTLSFATSAFVATRWLIDYDKQLRVFESDQTATNGEVSMVAKENRSNPDAWSEVFPEVRSKCEEPARYILAATTEADTHEARIQIDEVQEASCDPCLLGTWSLDVSTFQTMILDAMAGQGGGMPPGTSFEIAGNYYVAFDDESVIEEQRDQLAIIAELAGVGGLTTTIDSFATGTYSADGERLDINDLTESYNNTSVDAPFGGGMSVPVDAISGSGTYECGTDILTLTIDDYSPLTWTRVDKILEPPPEVDPGTP